MSDGFAALDRQWRYTYVKRAAERNARLRRDEMLGRTWWEVFLEFVGSPFESAELAPMPATLKTAVWRQC